MDIIPQAPAPRRAPQPQRPLSMDGVRRQPLRAPESPTQPAVSTAPTSPAPQPKLQLATSKPHAIRPVRPVSETAPRTATPQPAPISVVPATPTRQTIAPAPQSPGDDTADQPGFWQRAQTPLFIIGGCVAGFGMQSLAIGLILLAIYAVIAWATRMHSRTSFALALIALIAVPVILVFRHNTEVAGNFATYTFVLIVIGTISLIRENPGTGRRYSIYRKRS